MLTRTPPPPQRAGEKLIQGILTDIRNLKRAKPFQPDAQGRFRIGDVNLVFDTNDDGSIHVSLQNALTSGPLLSLGDLP